MSFWRQNSWGRRSFEGSFPALTLEVCVCVSRGGMLPSQLDSANHLWLLQNPTKLHFEATPFLRTKVSCIIHYLVCNGQPKFFLLSLDKTLFKQICYFIAALGIWAESGRHPWTRLYRYIVDNLYSFITHSEQAGQWQWQICGRSHINLQTSWGFWLEACKDSHSDKGWQGRQYSSDRPNILPLESYYRRNKTNLTLTETRSSRVPTSTGFRFSFQQFFAWPWFIIIHQLFSPRGPRIFLRTYPFQTTKLSVECRSTEGRPTAGRLSVASRSPVDRQSAGCRPTVGFRGLKYTWSNESVYSSIQVSLVLRSLHCDGLKILHLWAISCASEDDFSPRSTWLW